MHHIIALKYLYCIYCHGQFYAEFNGVVYLKAGSLNKYIETGTNKCMVKLSFYMPFAGLAIGGFIFFIKIE